MKYSLFKLSFKAPVHFGNGRLSGSLNTVCADTLFSAMYKEAISLYGTEKADELRKHVLKGNLLISDTMPYCGKTLFIPKPVIYVDGKRESDSSLKKSFKNLKYIPYNDTEAYLKGTYNPENALLMLDSLGGSDISTKVNVIPDADNEPYNVGIYRFNAGNGLYFICGCNDDDAYDMIYDIMDSLSYNGIGGKTSSGYGRFDYTYDDLPAEFENCMTGTHSYYMSLSVSIGSDENENSIAVKDSYFELIKRSGFVGSETYASGFRKKNDLYCFKGGSCFKNKFTGCIADVSNGGTHPVYRYSMPMFYGLDKE